ncbi:amino acid adenylation domain-containing protein, partial [Pyxidicoccus sp. 3LFB2]
EYLGRSDFQVKLRGFRIEPGEIESVLGADAAVRESVVLAREDAPGDTRLVAYVVLGDAADRGDVDVASQWKAIYDEAYARDDADVDPTFDLTGWNDSYTGEPLPPEQMREWVDTTVQQLLDLKPRRVLELGCGTGLLLYRLAPRCEAYWGVDFARPALGRIERQRERMGGALDSVRLLHRSVEDFSGIEPGTFDTVVLNSVIQTFSSTEFLLTVLRGAVRALKPGGRVFLGDVRSLELLEAFHASVRLHGTSGHVATSQFEHRVQRDLLADKELVLSPAFFTTLPRFIPGISRVEVLPKHGRYDNELSRFRYEVILHVGGVADAPARGTRPEWVAGAAFTLDTLRERLDARPERLAVRCLPNARVLEHTGLVELLSSPGRPTTVAGLREALRHGPETRGVEPEDLYALGSRLGYEVRVSWAGAHRDGALDVVFARPGAAATLDLWPESADTRESLDGLASNPLRGARSAREVARIRRELAEKLPSHMVPSAFVVMASLPRTPSGKVDRSALPAPEADRLGPEAAFIASRTPMEETVARIFGELLGQTRVGVADDFFALGGHSLLATQVVTRVRAQLGVELTLRTLFDAPTVALLAERIQGLQRGAVADLPMERLPRSPESRDTREPSFAQQRLWFLEQLHPGQTAYHIPVALRLSGPLDADVLRRSCAEVVRRHEALRTTFSTRDGRPVQVVHPASWFLSGGGLSTPDGRASQIVHPASLHVSGEGLSTSDDHTSRDVLLPALSVAPSPAAVPHTGAGHPHGDSHVAPDSWPLPIEDLRGIEDTEREAALQRRMSEEAHRAFDLEHGPLLRTVLLRSASGEHVLVLSMHHLVSDGWSMGVLVREVAELYAALAEGREAALPALPVQYADYAAWERRALEGDALASQLAWWRSRLHGAPALELPTDHARPAVRTLRGATHFFTVPAGRVAALEKLGQAQGATLFMVLMAGWQALLARYSGQTDFCVGTPVAHRTRPELEGLVGFFVNTLALRANLDGDPRFDALVARVREEALGAFAHQDVPFDRLVEALGGERDLSRTPLFQALFVLQNTPMQPPALPGLRVELLRTSSGTAKFDVALSLMERGGALEGQLEYSLDLFTSDSARRLAEHFLQLLRSVSEDANLRLGELSLMSQAERQQVLVTWNDTRAEYPSDATVHQLFSAQAGRTPAVEAVRLEDRALTYRELDARSNQLARHLLSLGLGTEPRIGVCLHRSLELPVALLGILKAGGCYVPLDPTYPAQRLAFIARDAGLTAVLTHPSLVSVLPTGSWSVVCLDSGWEQLARYPMDAVQASAVTDSLAYVTYTSGSTGTPKGVAVPHRGVLRLLFGTRFARFGPDEVILQVTPLTFDPHTLELWGGLLHGARLVFSPPHTPDVAELARLITEHRVTWMVLATALFDLMQQHQPEALARVTQLVVGGEVIPTSRVRERLAAGSSVVNAYGPTESTTITTALRLSPGDVVGTSVSIGGPIANTQVYVLDAALRPVPVGVPGELFIGGDGLARGYLGRPALTAERFLPHPFSSVPGARLYRSGDRVRWRQDGTLEFLGRLDFQVKVRGFRIELGEIEAVLRAHPAVSEAVVVVREDSVRDSRRVADGAPDTRGAREDVAGGRRLVAYVTPETVDTAGLRESLREQLPEYMVPSAFVALAALPLSSHGKVDREALPAPEAPRVTADFAEPRSPREQQVAALFREVLQVERVGLHDDFFVLGGHSLLATQVVTRLRARLGVELPLRTLFEAPTVSQLVKHFEALLPHGVRTDMPPLLPVARGEALPLSFAQQRLWFLDQLQPGRAVYNVPVALKLSGPLDVEALRSAFAEVVRRHEVLRTTFATRDDQPVQRVHPAPAHRALPVEDLRALDAAARDTALRRRMADEAHHPFDLATGPLLRTVLVRTEETEHVLLLCMHHLVSDGWSMGVLVREVAALYAAHQEGQPASLPELPVQYADFATWQRQWVQSEGLQAQVEALKARLQEVPALELPAESGRPATPTLRGASHFFTLPAELVHGLEQVGREQGATLFMVTLAAYEALLARYSGQDDFAVGSPIAHRTRAELEPLIGFFVNTLVLRTRLEGDPTFAELVDRVRESALAAYANQDVPFDRLVEALGGERTEGRAPLFQVMFALQNAPMQPPSLPGLQVDLLRSVTDIARFDLSLSLMERGGILEGTLEYSLDLLSPASAERLARHYRVLLEAVVRDAQVRVSRLPLMDAAEHHQVLVAWNTTHTGAHFADSIPSLFAAQVRRSPGAVAVEHEGRTLTYGALDARSNQLARHLRSLGLTPEARVGLCMERGPELVVGMLGILKAGGCYVPLDPAYPRQRLAFMLQDAGVACVVAQAPTVSSLPEHGRPMVCLDSDAAVLSRHPETALSGVSVSPGQLAYVIYTSGSTGTPKGAGVEHRSVASLVRDTNYVRLTPDDCIAQVATPSFDAATFEVWGALLNGARLAIISRDVTLSPPRFAQALRDVGATTVFLTTVLFNELVRECPGALGPLRNVLFGGDSADPRVVRAMVDAGFRGRLLNCYGPTEATVFSTFHPTAGLAADAVSVPIGGPLARVRLYVLDTHGEPVPPGVHGELFIGGEGVGRGYPGHPALTAERFVPDPFSDTPGARLYRTGDRVRWRTDGTLDFAGRMDLQVKVRGFRIEPGEVESALRAHPSVHEAVVVVREEAPGDKRLVAYVTGTSSPDAATLRSFLTERLPAHLVPSAFVAITAFPLTPSGKLDREALPAPSAGLATAEAPRVPERLTPFQQRVAALFRKLLHVEHVGLHDDFFALGGHSLLATQLVSRVRSTFQVELPLRALFVAPTVAGVTECVEEQFLGRLPEPKTPPPRPVPRDGALPLSFAQQRLWVLDQLQPGSSHYNVAGALRMEGVLDIEALRRALEHLVSRHEALRTTFAMKECQPVQVLHPHTGWPLPVTDLEAELRETDALRLATDQVKHPFPAMTREAEALSLGSEQASQSFPAMTREAEALSLATEEASESFAVMTRAAEAQRLATEEASHPFAAKTREAEALRLATEEASRPFDLGTGPLLRTRLLRLSAEHHVLVLVMHHIISDGWSIGVMVREVVAGYEAFASGKAPMLPSLPVQYADFAAWQRQWLQGDVLAREVDWWKAQLAGAPQVLDLPTDKPRPAVRTPRGALLPAHLPHELMVGLLSLARQEGTTPFMALLAAWQVLLSRYSRQEDVLVGSPIAGRRHGELEGLVGFFVNTLVLRARVRPEDSFRALLGQVRGTTLAAFEHQDLPFEKLVEELNVPRDVSRNPLVQVVFALQNAPAGELRAPGLTLRPLEVDNATARFDLGLLLTETADGLRGVIEYSTDLFEASTVARLVGHLRTLLEAAVATPDRPLATLPLLSSGERQQLLVEWNDTSRPYPAVTIPEAFSRQAALRPDAIALEYGEQRITYRQLEVRANRLAHLLRSRGVGRDSLVAVSLERGVELIVSLLGILKAGGAYVPLDAAYPAQRVALMLEDAKPQLMLTSRALREQLHLPETSPPCLFVEELTLESQPETPPASGSGPRDLAYVIFTSGSTGRPKGVAIEHRGVLRLVHSEPYAGFGMREPGLLLAPISFDGSVMEMWIPLLHGSRLVIFPARAVPSDLDTLGHVVERHGVTLMHLPAGLFSQLAEHRPDILGRLRAVHPVGDVLSVPHARDVLESLRLPVTNGYGPTETSIIALRFTMERPEEVGTSVAIGTPIANTRAYVLDAHLQPVPVGVPGELFLGGDGVARGYVSRPDLTAERFIPDPFSTTPGERLYRTGDLVRWRPDGALEFLGRLDFQVKVRGFRIELPEVEAALRALPAVHEAAVVVREDVPGDKRLVAYAMPREGQSLDTATLRAELRQRLPEYMVPSFFVTLPALPLNPSGKVDRKALPVPDAVSTGRQGRFVEPTHPLEQQLAALYARELGTERVGVHDHLFEELGGTSLSVVRIATRLREELKRELPVVWLFEHPTIHDLARRLEREAGQAPRAQQPEPRPSASVPTSRSSGAVAIIGMAGRFPGAGSVREFWRNLREGLESISRFSAEELEHLPGLPDGLELWQHPDFVPAGGVLDGIDRFDPAFFDMSLREAQWMDPQQRLFLQCAWTALEDAGLDPDRFPGAISLYAGATDSGYTDLVRATVPWDGAALFELFGTATHESLATKTSYKLGLTGESLLVYTACSTGLVAVHLACQSLLAGLSDVALAGAARITVPQRTGYVHQEGMIFSPDGHCRAFDARAQGTIAGNGVASVVMKRLEDAERDGDSIYAVIRATATNNDGRNKSGFTAPSVQGQAAVVTQALARAGVEPKDIGYVETHGTATPLGDPIEVAALQRAYGLGAEHRGTIALASLKTNVGHLDTVAGLAGLIKVALSLHHAELPPSLHFERPNPRIDFESGPFFVNTALRKWPRGKAPRRAAVSSFGVGGTNAHAVLEESPMSHSGSSTRTHQLVTLSARSPEALEAACQQLAMHAEASAADLSLADVAYTHAVGRKAFEYRRAVVAQDAADLAKQLRKPYTAVRVKAEAARGRRVALVFPGQGAQQVGMGRELYVAEPAFRAHVDACLALLEAPLRTRVRALLQGQQDAEAAALPRSRCGPGWAHRARAAGCGVGRADGGAAAGLGGCIATGAAAGGDRRAAGGAAAHPGGRIAPGAAGCEDGRATGGHTRGPARAVLRGVLAGTDVDGLGPEAARGAGSQLR